MQQKLRKGEVRMKKNFYLVIALCVLIGLSAISCKKNSDLSASGVQITVNSSFAQRYGTGIQYEINFTLTTSFKNVQLEAVSLVYYSGNEVTNQVDLAAEEIFETTRLTPSAPVHSSHITFNSHTNAVINDRVEIKLRAHGSDDDAYWSTFATTVKPPLDLPIIDKFEIVSQIPAPGELITLAWDVKNADTIELNWGGDKKMVLPQEKGQIDIDPFVDGEFLGEFLLHTSNSTGINYASIDVRIN